MEHRILNYKTSLHTAVAKKCKKGNFSSVELISTYQSNVANRKKNYDVDDLAEIERELDESALQLSHVRTATGTPPMETLYRELKVTSDAHEKTSKSKKRMRKSKRKTKQSQKARETELLPVESGVILIPESF